MGQQMINYMYLYPPVTANVAENRRMFGVGKGVLVVNVADHQGSNHAARLPDTVVWELGRHVCFR